MIAEEVRIQLVELLSNCIERDNINFISKLSDICQMSAKAAQDQNPAMKTQISQFMGTLCQKYKDKVGPYLKASITSFIKNLQH